MMMHMMHPSEHRDKKTIHKKLGGELASKKRAGKSVWAETAAGRRRETGCSPSRNVPTKITPKIFWAKFFIFKPSSRPFACVSAKACSLL